VVELLHGIPVQQLVGHVRHFGWKAIFMINDKNDKPDAGAETPKMARQSAARPGDRKAGKPMARILVIDDDPEMRAVLEQTLQLAGHKVELAADGRQGVAAFANAPADVVITDLYMPNQDGLEMITELRKRFPTVAIIAMSGRAAATALLSIAGKLGAVEVLQKPFVPAELLATVEKVLRDR